MIELQYKFIKREDQILDFFDENNNGGNNRGNSESGGQSGGPQSNGSERGSQNGGKQVQYYSNGRFSNGSNSSSAGNANYGSTNSTSSGNADRGRDIGGFTGSKYYERNYDDQSRKRMPGWAKALIIICLVILCIVLLAVGCSKLISSIGNAPENEVITGFGHDYIGTLYIEGTIDEYGTGTYNHQYILNAIDAMIYDDNNKGLILYINTPGGSVYASDEVYLKIREYQEITGRPVYSSMQSQATSGGYYISAPCDKIIANRNCWTGSIGVTMGTFIDLSELLGNLGIKTETITSGDNKSMGSSTEPMTDEQRAIFQALIDEAYEQFVGIVAEGRGMTDAEVKNLADGRIYTAQQALDNGLIDQISTYQEAAADMMETYGLTDCYVENLQPEVTASLSDFLGLLQESSGQSGSLTDAEAIEKLLELNGTFRVSYICNVEK